MRSPTLHRPYATAARDERQSPPSSRGKPPPCRNSAPTHDPESERERERERERQSERETERERVETMYKREK
ncbi:hypothetical protein AOLI_G00192750 [Acnodon oligacanthus]